MANPALKIVTCITAVSIMLLPAHGQEQGSGRLELHELPKGDADGFVTIIGGDDLKFGKGSRTIGTQGMAFSAAAKPRKIQGRPFWFFPFICVILNCV